MQLKSHVKIIISHVNIIMLHVKKIMSHVDIDNAHVNIVMLHDVIISLVWGGGQKYATTPFRWVLHVRGCYQRINEN